MATLTVRAAGPACPADVWERYAVPEHWPTWAPQIREVRTSARRIAPGERGEVVGFGGVAVRFEVEAVDAARRTWSWRVTAGPVRLHLEHVVEETAGGGTATRLVLRGPAAVVVAYGPIARLALRRLVSK